MALDLLPENLRQNAVRNINEFINKNEIKGTNNDVTLINVRNKETIRQAVLDDAKSVVSYLEKQPPHDNSSYDDLINFLKKLENNRKNKILDYIPEYEEFFRSIGY